MLAGRAAEFADGVRGALAYVRAPAPVPIVVAASGPRTTRMAGRIADGIILHQGLSAQALARGIGWAREGSTGPMPEISCWAPYSVAPTRAEAFDGARARVAGALATTPIDWFEGAERAAVEKLKAAYHIDRKSTRLNSSHSQQSRMPSSA